MRVKLLAVLPRLSNWCYWLLATSYLLLPSPAYAHAFGQSFTLSLPLWLYLYGGAAALIISFILVGFFIRLGNSQQPELHSYPRYRLTNDQLTSILVSDSLKFGWRFLAVGLLLLTIISGLIGSQDPLNNFSTSFFWIIFLLGFTYLEAIFGNLWSVINPWKSLLELVEYLGRKKLQPVFSYPKRLAFYPALVLYLGLIWLEILSGGLATIPRNLGLVLLIYTAITILGALTFGQEAWFKYGELFSVYFHHISLIGCLESKANQYFIRPFFAGLLAGSAENFSQVLFILFILASTAFDGFRSTQGWLKIESVVGSSLLSQTLLLLITLFLFLALYLAVLSIMRLLISAEYSLRELALKFALSLIPIGLVYNMAHYYTLLLIQGQKLIPQISDPFGWGWNLLGTANFKVNIGWLPAKIIWNSQVFFILLGHIAAVILAHLIAIRLFRNQKKALVSQLPMLALMVFYTIFGLWILSQPLRIGGG